MTHACVSGSHGFRIDDAGFYQSAGVFRNSALDIGHPALGLVDGDQSRDGEWFTVQDLPPAAARGGTFVLSWDEVFNVIDGDARPATYVNVPAGRYVFRAMGVAGTGAVGGDSLALTVLIHPPVWQRAWFWPPVAAGIVAMISMVVLTFIRQAPKQSSSSSARSDRRRLGLKAPAHHRSGIGARLSNKLFPVPRKSSIHACSE